MSEARDVVGEWLSALSGMSAEPLVLDDQGRCALSFGEGVGTVLEVPPDQPALFVYAPVGMLPEDPIAATDTLVAAMTANLGQAETGGGALAFEPESRMIVLCYMEEIERADAERLGDLLAHCHLTALSFRETLFPEDETFDPDGPGSPDGPPAPKLDLTRIIRG